MLLVQCPAENASLSQTCVERSGRKVSGFAGPADQVRIARTALGLADAPARMEASERLYALDLDKLVIPGRLQSGEVTCRPPRPEDRETLNHWRFSYDVETLGADESDETRKRSAEALDRQITGGNAWVAVHSGKLVSLSAFNATLPDIVQLGGIYTPPEYRGLGYAKAAVAASLVAARERGASRAVLFTDNPSAARSYEGVGFQRIGDFGLVLLQ
jgi:GNAT superfamily N-acetyltransferase